MGNSIMLSIQNLLTKISSGQASRKVSAVMLGFLLLLWGLFLNLQGSKEIQHTTSQVQRDQKQTLSALDHIENDISAFNTQLNKIGTPQAEIKAMHRELRLIQDAITGLRQDTNNMPTQALLAKENQKLLDKLNTVHTLLTQVKKRPGFGHKLPIRLPFRVLGIDIWNGQSMAEVEIGSEFALMAVNDTRAGWTLVRIDFDNAQVVFKNSEHHYLNIKL
jgi:hypothetical protein